MGSSARLLQKLKQLHPATIDLSLDRIRRLLAALGDPHERLPPTIHIAGTNGKGSCIAFARAILEAQGRRVGTYTSPGLQSLHECITLPTGAGKSAAISEERLAGVLERVLAANADAPLTSFEGETAAAFLAMVESQADVVLVEVGMGGRRDATNVLRRPAVTVIMPVAIDHADFLGPTIPAIAGEKAGILKPGVPCVVARQTVDALDVIRAEAKRVKAPLFVHGVDWDVYEQHGRLVYQDEAGLLDLPPPALVGSHQIANAGAAIAAVRSLPADVPDEDAIARGLQSVRWPARLQSLSSQGLARLLTEGSELWLDGGHNAGAAVALAQAMADAEERMSMPLVLVLGMLSSKSPGAFLEPFKGLASAVIAVPIEDTSRAYAPARSPEELAACAKAMGFRAEAAASLKEALVIGRVIAVEPIRVLICGSLHLAGAALGLEESMRAARGKGPSLH